MLLPPRWHRGKTEWSCSFSVTFRAKGSTCQHLQFEQFWLVWALALSQIFGWRNFPFPVPLSVSSLKIPGLWFYFNIMGSPVSVSIPVHQSWVVSPSLWVVMLIYSAFIPYSGHITLYISWQSTHIFSFNPLLVCQILIFLFGWLESQFDFWILLVLLTFQFSLFKVPFCFSGGLRIFRCCWERPVHPGRPGAGWWGHWIALEITGRWIWILFGGNDLILLNT